jgi:hypothetical protein
MSAATSFAVRNLDREVWLGDRIGVADRWWSRARGLLGRRLDPREGLLIRPCRAVHMFGMRYAIDVAFLDAAGRIVATYQGLRPARTTRYHRSAASALELPAGMLARTGTQVGDRLSMEVMP